MSKVSDTKCPHDAKPCTDDERSKPDPERSKPDPTAYGRLVDKMAATVATWPAEYQRSVDVHDLRVQRLAPPERQ